MMRKFRMLAGLAGVLLLAAIYFAAPASAGPQDAHYYYLINYHSKLCANVKAASGSNGAPLIQWDCYAPQQNDYWGYFVTGYANGHEYFQLQNLNSGKCANVQGAATTNGTYIIQWTCDAPDGNDIWYLGATGISGYAYIKSSISGRCLNVQGASRSDGARLIEYDCGAANRNDMWHFG